MSNRPLREGEARKRVTTPDDWHPCYEGGEVEVWLVSLLNATHWRVCVWGADDDGMERDFLVREVAEVFYHSISNGITHNALRGMGFQQA